MQKQSARIIPFPAIDAESTDDGAFAWPRRPTVPLVQQPFDFETVEEEGVESCEHF